MDSFAPSTPLEFEMCLLSVICSQYEPKQAVLISRAPWTNLNGTAIDGVAWCCLWVGGGGRGSITVTSSSQSTSSMADDRLRYVLDFQILVRPAVNYL